MWKFNITDKKIAIITPPKSIHYDNAEEFRNLINDLRSKKHYNAIIDMKKTVYIDSSGLGMLVKGVADMKSDGGDIRLCSVGSAVMDVLTITSLNKILKSFSDLNAALASFE
jgi:anti-sigma B factor antagonist